jgi:O-antigen ligase
MREAWAAISQNPIVGRGFSFSYADVQRTWGGSGHFVLYHSYHNAFLDVAGACGVPLGLGVFLFVTVLMIRLFRDIRRLNDDRRRLVASFLFTTGVAVYLQSHVNGEGNLLTTMMVFLAATLSVAEGGPNSAPEAPPPNPSATSGESAA